jgi:hypothetical protein
MLSSFVQQLEAFAGNREEEIPEVFDLQPIEERSVMVRVPPAAPAPFYFVDDSIANPED